MDTEGNVGLKKGIFHKCSCWEESGNLMGCIIVWLAKTEKIRSICLINVKDRTCNIIDFSPFVNWNQKNEACSYIINQDSQLLGDRGCSLTDDS